MNVLRQLDNQSKGMEYTVVVIPMYQQIKQITPINSGMQSQENQQRVGNNYYSEQTYSDRPNPPVRQTLYKATDTHGNTKETVRGSNCQFRELGPNGRKIKVQPDKTSEYYKCTPDNTIFISLDENSVLERKSSELFKMLYYGAEYEFKKRWSIILKGISKQMNSDLVTRIKIFQYEMYVNNKVISASNLIGGFEDVRIEDIIDFKSLAKQFPNIREMTIDDTILERAAIEFDQPLIDMFALFKYLSRLVVIKNGTSKMFNRQDAIMANYEIQKTQQEMKLRNKFDVVCAAKNKNFSQARPGYQNKVWTIHGGNKDQLRFLNANYWLYYKIIEDAIKDNYKIFDFFGTTGNPTPGNEVYGIHLFKKRFGGEYTEFIGEFDYILNPILYFGYTKVFPKIRKFLKR